jgi:hypothetical protein
VIKQFAGWIGELPDASYIPIDTVNLERDAPPSTSKGLRLGAVEVFIPTGGRWLYGLVGGTFDRKRPVETVLKKALMME